MAIFLFHSPNIRNEGEMSIYRDLDSITILDLRKKVGLEEFYVEDEIV